MSETIFFEPKGPFYLNELSEDVPKSVEKIKILDIKTLDKATSRDLTFLNSISYKDHAIKTKAAVCITKKKFRAVFTKKMYKNIC